MKKIYLQEKVYTAPEISVDGIAVETGFAASSGASTSEMEEEYYDNVFWE